MHNDGEMESKGSSDPVSGVPSEIEVPVESPSISNREVENNNIRPDQKNISLWDNSGQEELEPDQRRAFPLKFRGQGEEYFRIWLVNLALSILTLGIYSAWAKVRTKRYFYGNTELNGSTFQYHGNPWQILWGRLIVAVIAGAVYLASQVSIFAAVGAVFAGFLFLPWIFVKGMSFNMRYSSYRGVHFGFKPDYAGSYKAFFLGLFVTAITLGLGYPFFEYLKSKLIGDNSSYGDIKGTFKAIPSEYFSIYLKMILMAFGIGFASVALTIIGGKIFPAEGPMVFVTAYGIVVLSYVGYLFLFSFLRARNTNLFWQKLGLSTKNPNMEYAPYVQDIQLISDQTAWGLFKVYLTNIFLIIFTLGLGTPWAMIRIARYRADHLRVYTSQSQFDQVTQVAQEGAKSDTLGDASADMWDLDFGVW